MSLSFVDFLKTETTARDQFIAAAKDEVTMDRIANVFAIFGGDINITIPDALLDEYLAILRRAKLLYDPKHQKSQQIRDEDIQAINQLVDNILQISCNEVLDNQGNLYSPIMKNLNIAENQQHEMVKVITSVIFMRMTSSSQFKKQHEKLICEIPNFQFIEPAVNQVIFQRKGDVENIHKHIFLRKIFKADTQNYKLLIVSELFIQSKTIKEFLQKYLNYCAEEIKLKLGQLADGQDSAGVKLLRETRTVFVILAAEFAKITIAKKIDLRRVSKCLQLILEKTQQFLALAPKFEFYLFFQLMKEISHLLTSCHHVFTFFDKLNLPTELCRDEKMTLPTSTMENMQKQFYLILLERMEVLVNAVKIALSENHQKKYQRFMKEALDILKNEIRKDKASNLDLIKKALVSLEFNNKIAIKKIKKNEDPLDNFVNAIKQLFNNNELDQPLPIAQSINQFIKDLAFTLPAFIETENLTRSDVLSSQVRVDVEASAHQHNSAAILAAENKDTGQAFISSFAPENKDADQAFTPSSILRTLNASMKQYPVAAIESSRTCQEESEQNKLRLKQDPVIDLLRSASEENRGKNNTALDLHDDELFDESFVVLNSDGSETPQTRHSSPQVFNTSSNLFDNPPRLSASSSFDEIELGWFEVSHQNGVVTPSSPK